MSKVTAFTRRDVAGYDPRRVCEAGSDEMLIERIAGGDRAAMATLFRRHAARVFQFVTRLTGDAVIAEDTVNEVFVEVWRQAGDFERRSRVLTWVLSMARYRALSVQRQRQRQHAKFDEFVAESIPDQMDAPEVSMLRSDRSTRLQACIKQLSREHREVIDLVYYHNRTIEEVAEIVNAPKNTVKTRMFYARKRLAQLLAEAPNGRRGPFCREVV